MRDFLEDLMGDQPLGTGNNIAVLRKAAGHTQGQLANRAAISKSMLSKVEVGDRTASHALIAAVARALRVPVQRIHGQPYRDEPTVPVRIDALRDALRAWDLPTDDTTPRPLADLAADVHTAQTDRRDGHYVRLAANLPALLEELAAAAHATTDENTRRALFALLTTGYYCAHGLASRLGYGDLADAIDPKLAWAATRAHDPLAVALADWTRSASFQAAGDYDHGLQLLDRARTTLEGGPADRAHPATVTVLGSLHLRAVTLASRAKDPGETTRQLAAAQRLADGFTTEQRHYQLTFGPANCRIHHVAAEVELGRPAAAVHIASGFEPPPEIAPTRAGHHWIDLARANTDTGNVRAALDTLYRARKTAPEQTRFHPMVRETARVLISLHRRSNPGLTRLATWLGLNP
jgi:transcriptional regulator with XRE-family HTH domain